MTPEHYHAFVVRVCADGDAEVRRAYTDPNKIAGALQGFAEARQTANPEDLKGLLESARRDTTDSMRRAREERGRPIVQAAVEGYWWWRMRELQIEWVANVVSARLYNESKPVIVNPTVRAWSKAAEILGRRP